jgi:PadR family transcriptional regulator
MIGGSYLPSPSRSAEPRGAPLLESFRLELRRGFLPLAVLAELSPERHGYALAEALANRGIAIELTTLYPLLRRLESQGLLASEWRHEGRRRKRFYRLTTEGRRLLDQLLVEWKRLDLSLNSLTRQRRDEAA